MNLLDAQSATHCKVKLAGWKEWRREEREEREGVEERRGDEEDDRRGKGGVEWGRDGRGRDGRGRGAKKEQ